MLPCVGVIYQFNPKGVLFEFSAAGSDDVVGIVKPTAIKIKGNETIPASANTVELLSKFLQVGDELLCHVERQANPEKFVYDEEEEEVSGAGKVTKKSKKVEIYPEWSASSAELVTDANRNKKAEFVNESNHADADENFDLGIGDQYVEALDYDDVLFIDDVPEFEDEKAGGGSSVTSLNSSKTETPTAADQPKETPAAPVGKKTTISLVKTTTPASMKATTATASPAKAVGSAGPPCFKAKARLVQLKKPESDKTGDSKVTTAIFEILTGRFANRFISVTSCNMYVFGHNLGIANLMYHLQHGDEATVEYRVAKLKAPQDLMGVSSNFNPLTSGEVPFVKTLWIGTETKQTVSVTKDKELAKWMLERKISAKQFQDWVRNALPWKPYLPLASNSQTAKVIRYLRAQSLAVDAVLLDLRDGVNRGVGILLNTDFYVCGVNVLHSDLSYFLKPGDSIKCQVRPLLNADRYNLKLELSMVRNLQVSHVAYLGYVGPERPTRADLAPPEAGKVLEDYLKDKGITMEKFVALRKTEKPVVVSAAVNSPFPPGFGPIRPPVGAVPMIPGPPAFVARPPGVVMQGFGFRVPAPAMVPPPGSVPRPMVPVQMPPGPAPMPVAPVQMPPGPTQPPNSSLPPPNGAIPGVFGPFIPQVSVALINVATNLAARAVNVDSNDMRIRNLLHNPSEMEVAAKVARNLTEALVFKLQGNLQARMNSNLPGMPDLTKQLNDLEAIQKNLSAGGDVKVGATRPVSQERSGLDNGGKAPFKRSGSVPNDSVVKQPRFDELQPSVHSRLGPAVGPSENSSLDPVPLNVASVQQSKPSMGGQLNPFAFQSQSSAGQSGFSSEVVNPFLPPPEPSNTTAKPSRWTPAYSRMQEMKSETSGLSANQMAREAEKARQDELQREQQRLWEEYLEAKKKKEEQQLFEADRKKEAERLAFEAEQNRLMEERRRRMEEEDRLRQEAERNRALEEARRQAELEKQRQAELAKARFEEEERVRKFLAEEKQRKQQEEERIRQEIRRELERKQMEEERQRKVQEEFERKLREEHERRRAQEELEKKRRFEEQERLRQQEEMERKRKMEEEERERKRRIEEEERERMRREAERKRLEEQERLRAQQELERKRREEQERLRAQQEEMERKRKQEEEEKRHEQEMERMWRMEMEKKLKKQQEDDERERRMRETRGSGGASSGFQRSGPSAQGSGFQPWAANNPLPPAPKLSGMFGQEAAVNNPASVAPPPVVGGFRRSDVFGDRAPPAPNDFWKKFESGGPPPGREPPRQSTIANLKEASRMFQRQGGGGPAGNGGNQMNQMPQYMGVPPPPVIAEKNRGPNNDRRF